MGNGGGTSAHQRAHDLIPRLLKKYQPNGVPAEAFDANCMQLLKEQPDNGDWITCQNWRRKGTHEERSLNHRSPTQLLRGILLPRLKVYARLWRWAGSPWISSTRGDSHLRNRACGAQSYISGKKSVPGSSGAVYPYPVIESIADEKTDNLSRVKQDVIT